MTEKGLREAKRRATAHALAEAAFDLAVERGVDGFTIDDVATRAGYSRRTFANHFACKEEAITALAVERLREGLETLPPMPEDTPLLEWLMALARHQLSGGMLPLLQQLRGMALEHHGLEPYLADVQVQIRRTAQDAVLARAGSGVSRLSAHILVGAAYGALMSVLDGRVPVRLPGDPAPASGDAVTVDEFLTTVFSHLRRGF
ncbi:TetR/AcrR family transcriptional regulator [Intrasporangium sp.]|uniref:TetR/AcrR family transcriptional regulator n=1 Tax=Intrasporangium sp. TaxID=1925024 RepID=UPI00293AC063|nr:TetR/AcrR family transcriptional regulator [Intrasporangium sp.]MDV3220241.1 TetR/AcrR family transcriptional regulator [Intrasporangium sp.]